MKITTYFPDLKIGDKVKALRDIKTKNRTMKKGRIGTITNQWPYMLEITEWGKKLPVETGDVKAIEKLA